MKISSARHSAGRARRSRIPHLFHRVPVPAPDRPAFAPLPGEHMAQRPYDAVVVPVAGGRIGYYPAPAARAYRVDDVIEVTDAGSLFRGETGVIVTVDRVDPVKPLVVQLADGGQVYLDACQVTLIQAAPVADTLVFDAVPADAAERDDATLTGGAAR